MSLQRKTAIKPIAPTDASPLPLPCLTFHVQMPSTSFPTGGLYSGGSMHFSLNSIYCVNEATKAFRQYSDYKTDARALEFFLRCLDSTSAFEGGFDSLNSYDNAGVSLGMIQFARPAGGAGKLMSLAGHPELATQMQSRFGGPPFSSPAANAARHDAALLQQFVKVAASPAGISAQFAMAINQNVDGQFYFDKTYKRFLELNVSDPLCCLIVFDAAVNMGAGSVSVFKPRTASQSDGDWILAAAACLKRKDRHDAWINTVHANFA